MRKRRAPPSNLRELRKAAGLTQDALALATGASPAAISLIENGERGMSVQWMRSFARALGCSPADLLGSADNPDRLAAEERAFLFRYRAGDQAQRETLERIVGVLVS